MTSSFTQSDSPIDLARRAIRIASSAVRHPAVLGRMRYRFQSITSRIVFFFGLSRSRRRRATGTSSHPDASSAASIEASSGYFPVPRKSRERSLTPAMISLSTAATVCMAPAYRVLPAIRCTAAQSARRLGEVLLDDESLVAPVGEPLHRLCDRQPDQLVDLDARAKASAPYFHDPVARNFVAAAAVDVCGAAERPHELALESSLLADFAQRAVLGGLIGFDLALGQRPIVVGGAMDHGDLRFVGWTNPTYDAARRPYHGHIRHIQDLCCQRCSFVC